MEVKKYDFHYISADFPYSFYDWKRGGGVKAVTLHPENMTSGGHHEKTTDWISLLRQTDSRCSVMRLRCKVFANHYPIRRLQSRSSGWDMEESPAQRRQAGREKNVKREILTWQYSDVSTWWNYSEVPYWDETMSIISFTKCIFRLLNCNLKQ